MSMATIWFLALLASARITARAVEACMSSVKYRALQLYCLRIAEEPPSGSFADFCGAISRTVSITRPRFLADWGRSSAGLHVGVLHQQAYAFGSCLYHPDHPNHPDELSNIAAAAKATGVDVSPVKANSTHEIEVAFGAMARDRIPAVIVLPDAFFFVQARRIAELAAKNRLATMFWTRELVEAGGLIGYGHNNAEQFRRAATYVDKILKGAKPANLPVEQPTKLELVINLKTAKVLGLSIPNEMLLRADKIIE